MEVAGPLGTPLGLAQRKRASPRVQAGTSGFLSVSDSDRRALAPQLQKNHGTPPTSRDEGLLFLHGEEIIGSQFVLGQQWLITGKCFKVNYIGAKFDQ